MSDELSDEEVRNHFKSYVTGTYKHKDGDKQWFDKTAAIAALMADEKLTFMPYKNEAVSDPELHGSVGALQVLEHDVFAWGYTAFTPLKYSDLEDLYTHWEQDSTWGVEVWLCKKAGLMPQKPMADLIRKHGFWKIDEMGLRPNQ